MPTDKINQFRTGALFRLTQGGRTYRVVSLSEEGANVILRFRSIRQVKPGCFVEGTINLKLITKLHSGIEEVATAT